MPTDYRLEKEGFAIVPAVIEQATVVGLLSDLQATEPQMSGDPAKDRLYARRNLFQNVPGVRALAASPQIRALVEPFLGASCFAVRAIYFDKIPGANWKVPWHQDLSVAVATRRESAGFGPWSHKEGVLHAQAPASLLEKMLTVRVHLDTCRQDNGPLRVLPGTHRHGKLGASQITALRLQAEVVCEVESGGALLMRPLLLHASSAAQSPDHRRVLHLEYAAVKLPDGLEWHETVSAVS